MFAAQFVSYEKTNAFTPIVLDYLMGSKDLIPFYAAAPHLDNIIKIIQRKQEQPVDRQTLVNALKEQYAGIENTSPVNAAIDSLLLTQTFTICTAHQPNLFTGPLYFIYKIVHAIRLAAYLKKELPDYNFVPVYYMGSEDADLAELNHFTSDGKRYEWGTKQSGAVGRMVIDKDLENLINELEGQLAVYPKGGEWIALLRKCFVIGSSIQEATFQLVHALFAEYGLVVLIADNPELKKTMEVVFEEDLFNHKPSTIVTETSKRLNQFYNAQAHVRDINLFYLKDNIRERIERNGQNFTVCNTSIHFTQEEIKSELKRHPERFSPNVILRGLFQETILPNVAFIGGGGEIAYWLQLHDLFQYYKVPFPMLVFRNSFLILEQKWEDRIQKLGFKTEDIFQSGEQLLNHIIQQQSAKPLTLNGKLEKAMELYASIQQQASSIDPTLGQHVNALQVQAVQKLQALEKKMLRAEKRRFREQQEQITAIKSALFPKNGLQERVENAGYYYAKWGKGFIDVLFRHSLALEQEFTILKELRSSV